MKTETYNGKIYIGIKEIEAWPEIVDGMKGYGVRYEDGYVSFSLPKPFEKAYLPIDGGMPFEHALWYLKKGKKLYRKAYADLKDVRWIEYDRKVQALTIKNPSHLIHNMVENMYPVYWTPTSTDMVATDWIFIKPEEKTDTFSIICRLTAAMQQLLEEFPVCSHPIGAPDSEARAHQNRQKQAVEAAREILKSLKGDD